MSQDVVEGIDAEVVDLAAFPVELVLAVFNLLPTGRLQICTFRLEAKKRDKI